VALANIDFASQANASSTDDSGPMRTSVVSSNAQGRIEPSVAIHSPPTCGTGSPSASKCSTELAVARFVPASTKSISSSANSTMSPKQLAAGAGVAGSRPTASSTRSQNAATACGSTPPTGVTYRLRSRESSTPLNLGPGTRSAYPSSRALCPSLPGYGFSDRPATTGWGVERIARAWAELMHRLGYERYGAQGGDWGAMVTTGLGRLDADHVAGIHLNMPVAAPPADAGELTEREAAALAVYDEHRRWGTGYSQQQSTRPQTLGYGLVDSPAGQCAWIIEKFWAWTDCAGHPEHALNRDQLLDNVMLYWLPGTGASSARLYWESLHQRNLDPVSVPTGCSIFPREIARLPRRWVEARFADLRYWNELDQGGHFAAFEQPGLFVDEIRAFFRLVR
jgi:pimeloyl-ACP methyl ester carboxylesterase